MAHRSHCDDRPPIGVEHVLEFRVHILLLKDKDEGGEHDGAHEEEEEEQPKLLVVGLHGVAQRLQLQVVFFVFALVSVFVFACNPVEWRASLKILMILNVFTILVIFHSLKYWAVLLSSSEERSIQMKMKVPKRSSDPDLPQLLLILHPKPLPRPLHSC